MIIFYPSLYLAVPLFMFVMVAQASILPYFPLLGFVPQAGLLVALSWGLLRGVEEGAWWGFLAGLAIDLFSYGPFGVSAAILVLVVVIATYLQEVVVTERYVLPSLLAMGATLFYYTMYALMGRILGYETVFVVGDDLLTVLFLHGFLIMPVYWTLYGIERALWPQSVEL
ncbi:MAG TPA: rod shape-determining protein MreD [Anaerolineae bacterium]|nr:rod shape-determining protein MreD [Anaerolineae bacterium]